MDQLAFWSADPSRRHFWVQFGQASPEHLFFTMRYAWMYASQKYSGSR
jgi:hypothetical protein